MAIQVIDGGSNEMTEQRRDGPAWVDERNTDRGNIRVEQGFSALRADAAYDEAQDCEDCKREREESGDASALCEVHLARAMGMKAGV